MNKKTLSQDIIDRLLIAKNLLEKILYHTSINNNRYTISRHVLASHDAAELAIAGIAHYLDCIPSSSKTFLMDYFNPIKKSLGEDVPGRDFFSQLNTVRIGIKHNGIFPDAQQWFKVGEKTYKYISIWCQKYLNISFEDLDESILISNNEIKNIYDIAKLALRNKEFQVVFEKLASALYLLFENNQALRNLRVGEPRAEDALKLSAFGVPANEFLSLQEFLPHIYKTKDDQFEFNWEQEKFGHPANWRSDSTEFCLETFISVALCIQDAEWIPGTINFDLVYEYKITALTDNVEIVQERLIKGKSRGFVGPTEKVVIRVLKKGESIRGKISKKGDPLASAVLGREHKPILSFTNYSDKRHMWGDIEEDKVKVICVPKNDKWVNKYFPNLPEMEFMG